MDGQDSVGMAALWVSLHTVRVMVNRGLMSPAEVETIHDSLIEAMQGGHPQVAAIVEAQIEPAFVEIHEVARLRWKGTANPA